MTYPELLEHIYGLARFGQKPGLERISPLLQALGNPQEKIRTVHVAGTNGKGSTAAFLSSNTVAGGYRTGLFTSPHLIHFTERIRVDGADIDEDAVMRVGCRVLGAAGKETTFFEIVTAMALLYFAEQQVDLAVLESGMGGGGDATNAASGILTVITPVSLDHQQYLGESIADIAAEKGGILKPETPLVCSRQPVEALEVLRRTSVQQNSLLFIEGEDFDAWWEEDRLAYRGLEGRTVVGMIPGIPGRYQAENAASALCAAELLTQNGFILDDVAVRKGIETARWPGRMEFIGDAPRFLLDGAHNAAGAEAVAGALAGVACRRLHIVAGVMGDKDAEGIIRPLLPFADVIIAVSPRIMRSMPSAELASLCRRLGGESIDGGTVGEGLVLARKRAEPDDVILVCGSLFTVGEARAFLLRERFEPCRG